MAGQEGFSHWLGPILISVKSESDMRMISFTLRNIDLGQIDTGLLRMPEHWEKVKGWRFWGCGLILRSQVNRQLNGQHVIIREWEITMSRGRSRLAAFLWIDSDLESCEVFLTGSGWLEEQFPRMFIMSLLNIDDPSQVDVSSFLAQNQT